MIGVDDDCLFSMDSAELNIDTTITETILAIDKRENITNNYKKIDEIKDRRIRISFLKDGDFYYIFTPNGYYFHEHGVMKFKRTYNFKISNIIDPKISNNKFIIEKYQSSNTSQQLSSPSKEYFKPVNDKLYQIRSNNYYLFNTIKGGSIGLGGRNTYAVKEGYTGKLSKVEIQKNSPINNRIYIRFEHDNDILSIFQPALLRYVAVREDESESENINTGMSSQNGTVLVIVGHSNNSKPLKWVIRNYLETKTLRRIDKNNGDMWLAWKNSKDADFNEELALWEIDTVI
jgi:hypothetical protein